MPKVTINTERAGKCLTYIQASRTAHSFKDLEKHLPQVASISGMQVKDYLQHLSDENKVRVEKIGSGNWYWSFPSEAAKTASSQLELTRATHAKQASIVADLKSKVADTQAANQSELDDPAGSRDELMATKAELEGALVVLRTQLAAYKDNDPTELERVRGETKAARLLAEVCTDDVGAMEDWFKGQGQDSESMMQLKMGLYDGEFDEEEGGLKELA